MWAAPDGSEVKTYSAGHYSLDYNGLNQGFYKSAGHIANAALEWANGYNDKDPDKAVMPILSDWDMSPAKDYSDLIKTWNGLEKYENDSGEIINLKLPKIQLTTSREFIDKIAANTKALKTIMGERPDLWMYIHGPSHERAVKASRQGDRLLVDAEKFATIDALTRGDFNHYPEQEFHQAWNAKIYPDHGWGGKNGDITDAIFKAKYEYAKSTADKILNESTRCIAQRILVDKKGIPVVLFNSLGWPRKAPAVFTAKFKEGEYEGFKIINDEGLEIPFQVISLDRYASGAIKNAKIEIIADLPSLGYSTVFIQSDHNFKWPDNAQLHAIIETPYYSIRLGNGGIASIKDKRNGQELLNTREFLGGEVFTLESKGNGAGEFVQVQQPTLDGFDKVSNYQTDWAVVADGPIFYEAKLRQPIRNATVELNVKVYYNLPRIDLHVNLLNWEGVMYREYRMAMPLNKEISKLAYEVPYGILRIGQDEMEGAAGGDAGGKTYNTICKDIHPRGILNWIGGYGENEIVVLSSSVVGADYIDPIDPQNINLQPILLASRHSCHWEGNPYPQTGDHSFDFSLSTGNQDLPSANRMGIAANTPVYVVYAPDQSANATLPEKLSFFQCDQPDVILSALKKAENSNTAILRFYNTSDQQKVAKMDFYKNSGTIWHTNLIEQPAEKIGRGKHLQMTLGKYAIETIRFDMR